MTALQFDQPSMTDDELIEAFLTYLRKVKDRSPRTIESYRATLLALRKFVEKQGLELSLESMGKRELLSFLQATCARPDGRTARPSWNKHLSAFRVLYGWLYREEVIDKDPSKLIERKEEKPNEKMPLSVVELVILVSEVERLSRLCNRRRNVAMVTTLIHTGMRVSELTSLNVGQVDLTRGIIHDLTVKGGKTIVAVLNEVVVEALRTYLKERVSPRAEEPLFISSRGTRLGRRTIYKKIRQAGEAAGFQGRITPHVLRHSHATCLAELKVPIATIQAILGHASSSTTSRYVHMGMPLRRKAGEALAELWREHQDQGLP